MADEERFHVILVLYISIRHAAAPFYCIRRAIATKAEVPLRSDKRIGADMLEPPHAV
jgi:hypothetical protein